MQSETNLQPLRYSQETTILWNRTNNLLRWQRCSKVYCSWERCPVWSWGVQPVRGNYISNCCILCYFVSYPIITERDEWVKMTRTEINNFMTKQLQHIMIEPRRTEKGLLYMGVARGRFYKVWRTRRENFLRYVVSMVAQ